MFLMEKTSQIYCLCYSFGSGELLVIEGLPIIDKLLDYTRKKDFVS